MHASYFAMPSENSGFELYKKPKILKRTINTILINWEDTLGNTVNKIVYTLQQEDTINEWKTIYWGYKQEYLVENLDPCTCYNFRLGFEDCVGQPTWINFKTATDLLPYFVTHLTRAVKFGKTSVIRKIINKTPSLLEIENIEGKTPLHQVIEKGDVQLATFLITLGANVNTITLAAKKSPLMVALSLCQLHIANMLIDKGANIQFTDVNGMNGLHHAVDSNNFETVKFAANLGFDINALDNMGWSALIRAVILECSEEIIQFLLDNGADPKLEDKNGFNFYKHLDINNRVLVVKQLSTNQ